VSSHKWHANLSVLPAPDKPALNPQLEEEVAVEDEVLEAESSLEAEFQAAANEKLAAAAAQPASLSSLFEDEEVVEVDATVTDETLLVRTSRRLACQHGGDRGKHMETCEMWWSLASTVCRCRSEML
jgi:hypothetical protein